MTQTNASPGERIHSADLLRAFLMVSVIFIHAGTLTSAIPALVAGNILATLFVMMGFFLLSGFFASMSLTKDRSADFLRKRLVSVLVPLAVLLPTNVVALWAIDAYARARAEAFPRLEVGTLANPWHLHFWFLFVLAAFIIAAPPLNALAEWAARTLQRRALPPLVLGLALATLLTLLSRAALKVLAAATWPSLDETWLVLAVALYLPSYTIGLLAWHHPGLRAALIAPRASYATVWLATAAAGLVVLLLSGIDGPPRRVVEALTGLALFGLASFAFARLAREHSPAMAFVIDAAYTVYLVHFLCVWLFLAAAGAYIESYAVLYGLAVCVGLAVPLVIHALLVQRSEIAAFLLNGRRRKRRTAPAAARPEFVR